MQEPAPGVLGALSPEVSTRAAAAASDGFVLPEPDLALSVSAGRFGVRTENKSGHGSRGSLWVELGSPRGMLWRVASPQTKSSQLPVGAFKVMG